MQLGMGVLRWTPEVFWKACVRELYSAIEGWQESHGIERKEGLSEKDMAEIEKMMEKFADEPVPGKA
jgi:hypothetical protein